MFGYKLRAQRFTAQGLNGLGFRVQGSKVVSAGCRVQGVSGGRLFRSA
jgi:hypothetical protein